MVNAMLMAVVTAGLVMAGLGLLTSGILLIAARKFYVFEDPRIAQIEELLPGANCGGCGLPGCKAYAEALVLQGSEAACPVCGADVMAEIGVALGKQLTAGAPVNAVVMCAGHDDVAKTRGLYEGLHDCRAAHMMGLAEKLCPYGCMGLGTCLEACPFDAIYPENGVVKVDPAKCTGCGNCLEACPRDLFQMIPEGHQVIVACNSKDKAKAVKGYCSIGCVACKACVHKEIKGKVRGCPEDAIAFENNLAIIDHDKCVQCWECVDMCRTETIIHVQEEVPAKAGSREVSVA